MWIALIIIIVSLITLLVIRSDKYLRTYFNDKLYIIGIQLGNIIYTPVADIYLNQFKFDIILSAKYRDNLYVYKILNRECSKIALTYPSPVQTLVYYIDNKPQEHKYLEGSPFIVHRGELVLFEKKRKGLGFIRQEIGRSNKWPFIN